MKPVSILLLAGAVGCAFIQPVPPAEAVTYKEKVLWSFGYGADGVEPYASVIDEKGTLYGTTTAGGDSNSGTVFALDLNVGTEKVLYSFGYLEADPYAGVIDVKGTLYGTANGDDQGGAGTVFGLDPSTGEETTLYTFCSQHNCADGEYPGARLIRVNGKLYGTTSAGGANHMGGTIFSIDRNTGAYKVLYSFCSQTNCTDGAFPLAGLVNVNGTLYGTTVEGGSTGCGNDKGCGTVFSFDPNTGAETVLHTFCSQPNCVDGARPIAGLIYVNDLLYGTTSQGDGNTNCYDGCGTVFSIDLGTGTETVLYSFCSQPNCADGANPLDSLIDVNGTLYGTTFVGGTTGCGGAGCGTAFSLDLDTGTETVLYAFCSQQKCTDGDGPNGGLIAVNGKLYGTTTIGGAYGYGTVFVLKQKN